MSDESNLTLVANVYDTCVIDYNAGSLVKLEHDMGQLQGFANAIYDPVVRANAQTYVTQADALWTTLSAPSVQADNSAKWASDAQNQEVGVANRNADPSYLADANKDVNDINNGLKAKAAGRDPALGYNNIPDPGGLGSFFNVSGQSPRAGDLSVIDPKLLAALGGTTVILVVAGLLYAKFVLRLF